LTLDGAAALLAHPASRALRRLDLSHCVEPQHGPELFRLVALRAAERDAGGGGFAPLVALGLAGLLFSDAGLAAVCRAHAPALARLAIGGVGRGELRALGGLSERGAARALGSARALERLSAVALPEAVTPWVLERVEAGCPRLAALRLTDCAVAGAAAPGAPLGGPRRQTASTLLAAVAGVLGSVACALPTLVQGPLTPEQQASWEARYPYPGESFVNI